jgi:hypothetical protein
MFDFFANINPQKKLFRNSFKYIYFNAVPQITVTTIEKSTQIKYFQNVKKLFQIKAATIKIKASKPIFSSSGSSFDNFHIFTFCISQLNLSNK